MFCSQCGKEISEKAVICVGCGAPVKRHTPEDTASSGWWWLGFLVPLAGLIVWLTCNDTQPNRSKKAGTGALVGVIVSAVLSVLWFFLSFLPLLFLLD